MSREHQGQKQENGILLTVGSLDIPYAVFTGHVEHALALVPSSQVFKRAEFDRDPATTKAQMSRVDYMFEPGTTVRFKPVIIEGRTLATSIGRMGKPIGVERFDRGIVVKSFAVINPMGRFLYSPCYDFVDCAPELLCDSLLADVVYEARLLIRVDLDEAECIDDPTKLPQPRLIVTALELEVPTEEQEAAFNLCPWRTADSNRRYLGDDFNPGKLPRPPASELSGICLLYLGAHRALFIDSPRRKVLIPRPNGLKVGRQVVGTAFWSSCNDAYIVYRFNLLEGRDIPMMPAFIELNPFADQLHCEETRFHVKVRPAAAFKSRAYHGFYMAVKGNRPSELLLGEKVLIEDPLHLLIDQRLPPGGLRVGIRPNKDYGRVAKFTISQAVNEAGERLNRPKRHGDLTVSTGGGFLANRLTGSVFCSRYPQTPLYLPVPDRAQLRVGEQINFKAAYCDQKHIYVIVKWERALDVESQSFEPYSDAHLFIETLKESRLDCSDRCCLGAEFGLITDREEVLLTYAKRNKIPMPKNIRVRVRENTDPSRSTFFEVHSVVSEEFDRQKSRTMEQIEEFEQFTPLRSLTDSAERLNTIDELHSQLTKLLLEDDESEKRADSR